MLSFKSTLLLQKNKFVWLIFALIAIATLPPPAGMLNTQVDASGAIGISWVIQQKLQIGKEVMMQIGPLGHLFTNAYTFPSHWFPSMLYVLFSHLFLVFSLALLAIKLSVRWKDYLLVFPLIITLSFLTNRLTDIPDQLQISIVIILYLLITHKIGYKYKHYILISISMLLAIHSLMKFDMAIMSVYVITIFSIISIFKKEYKNGLVISLSYVLFIPLIWILANQNLNNLFSYFTDGILFSSGYSYALSIEGNPLQIYEGIIGVAFVVSLFIFSIITKTKNLTIFILLYSFLFFESFKHAFVRHDMHVLYFFFTYGMFFLSSYIIYKYHTESTKYNKKRIIFIVVLALAAIACVANIDYLVPALILPDVSKTIPVWGTVIPLALNETYQAQIIDGFKDDSKKYFHLDEKAVQIIGNKTMDILPWDVALAWGYDFNWSAPPTWQSFLVFNPKIDEINAQHFSDEKAPEVVLYAFKSIDLRYPLFDTPKTIATILQNYKYEHISGEYLILSHNLKEEPTLQESLGTIKVKIGEPITIPKYESGYLFANVDLQFSTFGKFMNVIFKPAQAHMRFKFSDSSYSDEFRLIPVISNGGVFVSQYVSNVQDLKSIFTGSINQDLAEIILYVDDPNHYENEIEVEFIGVPANIQIQNNKIMNNIPNWNEMKYIQGGMHSIDYIGNRLVKYEQGAHVIKDNSRGFQFIDFYGWGVDTTPNDGNVKTFVVLQDRKNVITIPTKKVPRPDLVSVFQVEEYLNGGWKTTINSNEIENGCYALSLRILKPNGQEYYDVGKTEKSICFD